MPEGVGYGPQFTASVGKTLNVIGDYCYANSGVITNGSSAADTVMLDFNTGSYIAVMKLYFTETENGDNNVVVETEMDGIVIYESKWDQTPAGKATGGPFLEVLVPPYSNFTFSWGCSATKTATVVLTGRLYGKIE